MFTKHYGLTFAAFVPALLVCCAACGAVAYGLTELVIYWTHDAPAGGWVFLFATLFGQIAFVAFLTLMMFLSTVVADLFLPYDWKNATPGLFEVTLGMVMTGVGTMTYRTADVTYPGLLAVAVAIGVALLMMGFMLWRSGPIKR